MHSYNGYRTCCYRTFTVGSATLALHEHPIISRLVSLEHPVEIREGMVFALETYCPAADGVSAARIEEEVVVTSEGTEVITKFPAQELFVANAY
jgi:Xaa-Pro dipeptidase